jgi:hypothetical protein
VIDILTQRVFYDVVGRPFLRGMMLPLLVFVLAVAVLDANVDWVTLRRDVANLAPWQQTVAFTALIVAWSWPAGRALRPAWRNPTIAFLVRQPIRRVQWAAGLLPSLLIAFVPVAAIWWLFPQRTSAIAHYAAFIGLGWPLILGASYEGIRGIALMAAGTLTLAAMVYAYCHAAWAAYLALVVTLVQLPLSTAWLPRQVTRVHERIAGHISGSGVIATLLRRDLRCAFRSGLRPFVNLVVLGSGGAAMMLAFRVNGGAEEREAFLIACALFSIGAAPAYEILERMKAALGPEIMRRRWPVTHRQRSLALAGVVATFVGPSAVLVALAGSTMGGGHMVLFASFVATTAVICSTIFSLLLSPTRSAIGVCYLAMLVHSVIAIALPAWGYAIFAAAALPAGFLATARAFSAFTARAQRMRVEPAA